MDPAFAPLILVTLIAAMAGTWIELRSSLQPANCRECPHCRDLAAARRIQVETERRRQAELNTWYAKRHGLDDRDDDDRWIG